MGQAVPEHDLPGNDTISADDGTGGSVGSFLSGVGRGATAGLVKYPTAGVMWLERKLTGAPTGGEIEDTQQVYNKQDTTHPIASTGGQIVGNLVPASKIAAVPGMATRIGLNAAVGGVNAATGESPSVGGVAGGVGLGAAGGALGETVAAGLRGGQKLIDKYVVGKGAQYVQELLDYAQGGGKTGIVPAGLQGGAKDVGAKQTLMSLFHPNGDVTNGNDVQQVLRTAKDYVAQSKGALQAPNGTSAAQTSLSDVVGQFQGSTSAIVPPNTYSIALTPQERAVRSVAGQVVKHGLALGAGGYGATNDTTLLGDTGSPTLNKGINAVTGAAATEAALSGVGYLGARAAPYVAGREFGTLGGEGYSVSDPFPGLQQSIRKWSQGKLGINPSVTTTGVLTGSPYAVAQGTGSGLSQLLGRMRAANANVVPQDDLPN